MTGNQVHLFVHLVNAVNPLTRSSFSALLNYMRIPTKFLLSRFLVYTNTVEHSVYNEQSSYLI